MIDTVVRWLLTTGVHIALALVFAVLAARAIRAVARRISRRLTARGDGTRSQSSSHRQTLVSVVASVAITLLYVGLSLDIAAALGFPIGSLVAPAAVLGGALGFGAQRIVGDLLSGFFVITEKQYGFGDLIELTITGGGTARGTVEAVTLRITRLRTGDGEVYTIPNGTIVKALNLSKDWARAVVDIPLPATADIVAVNDVLRDVSAQAMGTDRLAHLLLDEPQVMGVESIQVDTINVRMVARTLPGKQFEVSRELRALVVPALRREGIAAPA
ncbi:mechanosensitive ion channel family protein [Mycolicibacterium obuense]|uniref:Mechanosensitive ion channel family protein n=1 Tax=Mycolicibacterium obuense TaxID=1807 RepID=A0A4R5XC58_9MYCO|nr:mechanosensitive ion channel family protein [Mycolicibacterium obuense]TDL11915.1 mechanosensitive ion channel family protein [Mycolicibacterium obuense]